jgi:hypothetical protein
MASRVEPQPRIVPAGGHGVTERVSVFVVFFVFVAVFVVVVVIVVVIDPREEFGPRRRMHFTYPPTGFTVLSRPCSGPSDDGHDYDYGYDYDNDNDNDKDEAQTVGAKPSGVGGQ